MGLSNSLIPKEIQANLDSTKASMEEIVLSLHRVEKAIVQQNRLLEKLVRS